VTGAIIRALGLWQLPVELVYRLLCALIFLLPGLATYLLLARVLDDGWLALPPAFLALTLSAGLRGGVEESVRWGILTSRLSLGLLPLVALALRAWIDAGRRPVWVPLAAAAVILAHPAHGLVAGALVGLGAVLAFALRPQGRVGSTTLAVTALTLGLVAFWLLPLVARHRWVIPLAWGEAGLGVLAAEIRGRAVLVVVLGGALLAWGAVLARRRPFEAWLAVSPLFLGGLVAADAFLFRYAWSAIEPARLFDAAVMATVWAAGLGYGAVAARLTPHQGPLRALVALGAVATFTVLPGPASGEQALTVWPRARASAWPTLEEVDRAHDVPRLWAALRGTPDRVLFLTSALRLTGDPSWYAPHSHLLSLTPIFAGREIVNGTYTHPAPLAGRFYAGEPSPPARITTLVERLDGQRLLGQPLERLSADTFEPFARRLRIATVVVPAADAGRVPFLAERYTVKTTAAGFAVFERRDRPWPVIERISHRRYRVFISPAGGVWIPTGFAAYPLWQAKGRPGRLETRVDAWGLLEFRVPLDLFEAELVYAEGPVEWLALGITLVAIVGAAVWAWGGGRAAGVVRKAGGRAASARRRRSA
jgi:hypothetical protein